MRGAATRKGERNAHVRVTCWAAAGNCFFGCKYRELFTAQVLAGRLEKRERTPGSVVTSQSALLTVVGLKLNAKF